MISHVSTANHLQMSKSFLTVFMLTILTSQLRAQVCYPMLHTSAILCAILASGKAITLCSNIHEKAKRANLLDDAGQLLTHTERPHWNLNDIHMAVASGHNTLRLWFWTRSLFFTTACSFKRPWQKQHCGDSQVGFLDLTNLERNINIRSGHLD